MSHAADAYLALIEAMETTTPVCINDDLFTADSISKDDAAFMATLCKACPLFDLCKNYAQLERVKAGFWAGKQYPSKKADPE